ncbi:LPD29 domain-containing protein [Azohydromonas aeria]|uniref:LPD29 domain-containing protein n=1 Tax=Azohydromonas aeria TaxID=2590212 RepID=UPI0012F9EB2D|nr:LPD29 domain-containing protein [Azohydromonas aeria]
MNADAQNVIGLGIEYTGDMANTPGRGAVVAVREGFGGHAALDIILKDGREWRAVSPLSIKHPGEEGKPGARFHALPLVLTAEEVAELQAGAAMRKASEKAKADEAAARFAAECTRLRQEFPYLEVGQYSKTAAANLRKMLKTAFPRVKFSVRCDHSSINVRWTDGPTAAAVCEIAHRFKAGHFDGMTDCYEYSRSPWGETFGSAEYVFEHREISDALLARAIEAAAQKHGQKDRPSVADYRAGRADRVSPLSDTWGGAYCWQSIIYRTVNEMAGE